MAKAFAEPATRLDGLGSAVFTEMENLKQKVEARGVKVINLGIGSPDQPPAPHVKQALMDAVAEGGNYRYPLTHGLAELRQAIARWYYNRFAVELDPETEVLTLMGSQDGLAHIYTAFINPGDIALIPDPGYPIYTAGLLLAGGRKYPLPLQLDRDFLPDLDRVPPEIASQAKLMFLNYPNNPAAATADLDFFRRVVSFAQKYKIMVCHDNAYSELAYDGYRPPSFLQAEGAKEIGIEFHSVSKTYNLAGCRLGFVVGNAAIIAGLAVVKSNIDFGVFRAVQAAGIAALDGPQGVVKENAARYQARRDVLVEGLARSGWVMPKPKGSMFVWAPLPEGQASSVSFAVELLEQAGVLVIPGVAFGAQGEGYVRFALVEEENVLREAVGKISAYLAGRRHSHL